MLMINMKIISQADLDKIPLLAYDKQTPTREFIVLIDGISSALSSVKYFKWSK